MNKTIRQAALRATAKIALGLTVGLTACAAQVEVEPAQGQGPDIDADPIELTDTKPEPIHKVVDKVVDKPKPGAELACNAPKPPTLITEVDLDQLTCCSAVLEPHLPQQGEGWEEWLVASKEIDNQACCNVIVAAVDIDYQLVEGIGYETFQTCCQATGFAVQACTPWGPPVPPSFDVTGLTLRRLEVA